MNKRRVKYLVAAVVVVCLGLASRRYSNQLPQIIASYAGDTLWALTAFLCTAILFPKWATIRVCLAAMLFALVIEFSQLYHSPWLDHIRHTTVGALVLGQGFLWSDIICYAVGVGLGYVLDKILYKRAL
jgi:Protein of unknown function (DUF2809)